MDAVEKKREYEKRRNVMVPGVLGFIFPVKLVSYKKIFFLKNTPAVGSSQDNLLILRLYHPYST